MCWPTTFFFFNDSATTEISPLSLHDALPISRGGPVDEDRLRQAPERVDEAPGARGGNGPDRNPRELVPRRSPPHDVHRSEEHTSELQSRQHLVCRLLLEKKNQGQSQSVLYPS